MKKVHLAALAGRRGELERAERELGSAIDLLTRLGDRYAIQAVRSTLATALQLQGKYQESLSILEQSAKEALDLGDERTLATIFNSHMVSLQALGKTHKRSRSDTATLSAVSARATPYGCLVV
jgi:tetratricopeptide (TPR) repeat protein